ncbi:hypothetical protein FLONG3_2533 [Fusarium longipes]|uniref:2EXR domain-containing protein n=1 Tax=Fusarium longipes TaxID=694270 RepID=A0A395T3J0_9HYPO|nr:hypothetical protein FLONG3_2533 [Fusarium longipes]
MPRRKKCTPSFTRFPYLPLELQDEIWKAAIEIDFPAAHIIDIHAQFRRGHKRHTWIEYRMNSLIETSHSRGLGNPMHGYPLLKALMFTCQRSLMIVMRFTKKWESIDTSILDHNSVTYPLNPDYAHFHYSGMLQASESRKKIYTSNDLVIIGDPWRISLTLDQRIYPPELRPQNNIPVKYAAVPYLSSDSTWSTPLPGYRGNYLAGIFRVLNELRILYILLHPNDIRRGERFEVLSLLPAMKEHLEKYKRAPGESLSKTFYHQNRVYREISDVLLMKLSQLPGLPQLVTDLERIVIEQRAKNGGDKPPLIIRFMTW